MALYDSIYNELFISTPVENEEFNFTLDTALYSHTNLSAVESDTINFVSTRIEESDTWLRGMEGASRQGSLIGNSSILSIIVIIFLFISIYFKECQKLFSRFTLQLLNYRKHGSSFDEHTAHETRLTTLMIIQYLIYAGILLCGATLIFSGKTDRYIGDFNFLISYIGLLSIYYIFQLCAYSIVGYTFADNNDTRQFLRSFNASQSMCGIALIVPSLMILFYPQALETLTMIGGIIYLLFRLVFISNGFSIFYKNIFSLVYFILYLCTLEIIPLIYVFKLALLI